MTAQEMIKRYMIHLAGVNEKGEEMIRIVNNIALKRDKAERMIRENKAEIIATLKEEQEKKERERLERKERINGIEGLNEIREAREDLAKWRMEFNRSFDDVGGLGVRQKPEYDMEALYTKYPRAKAYLDAEELSYKSNFELSAIGSKALEMVIFGSWEDAVRYMEEEREKFTTRHLWD